MTKKEIFDKLDEAEDAKIKGEFKMKLKSRYAIKVVAEKGSLLKDCAGQVLYFVSYGAAKHYALSCGLEDGYKIVKGEAIHETR